VTHAVVFGLLQGLVQACRATHVLLPGTVLPGRADTTAVIGTRAEGQRPRRRAPADRC
jgi:hypothetical protein